MSGAASALEHAASDALGTVEHAAEHRLHDLEAVGAALVHGFEHPDETLDAAASGLETAAGEVADFGGHMMTFPFGAPGRRCGSPASRRSPKSSHCVRMRSARAKSR